MSCSTSSQMWGGRYLPRSLFNDGSLTLMYIASLMVLMKPCGPLPTMEKLSKVMLCPVVCEWSKMRERALRCSLYLSTYSLPVSTVYSIVHPGRSHLYLYMTPPFWMMLSLSLAATKHSLTVLASLK